jgi:hypothetical protein
MEPKPVQQQAWFRAAMLTLMLRDRRSGGA